MAQDFNTGPNAAPGGAPENARVNDAAMNAELKQAQILQNNTIKGLTDTIDKLTKQYEELTQSGKELSQDEANVSKQLQDKIQDLSDVLKNMKAGIAKGEQPASLSSIGQKERIQTFDRLTSVIKDFQKSNAEFMKSSSGDALDFDTWFASYTAQKKSDIESLESSEDNNLLLEDIKKILKSQSSDLANLTDEELTTVAKKSLKLSIDEKKRDLDFYEQNKDIIKLNRIANENEQEGVKKIISSAKFDPTKPILEYGFKSINKDMDTLIKNTKHRTLLQIVADLLGPLGHIMVFMIKVLFIPLAVILGLLVGVVQAQFKKLQALGRMFSGEFFVNIYRNLKLMFGSGGPLHKLGNAFLWFNMTFMGLSSVFNRIQAAMGRFILAVILGEKGFAGFIGRLINTIGPSIVRGFSWITGLFGRALGSPLRRVGDLLYAIGDIFRGSISKIRSAVNFILPWFAWLGNKLTTVGAFLLKPFDMLNSFLNSRTGRIFSVADRFLGGIFSTFNTFRKIGLAVAGWLGPIAGVLNIFRSLPDFFHRIFHGTFREAVKAIMGMIVFILTQFFSSLLGPIGGVIAITMFNFEKIMKWFDPIFDFLLDIAMWLGGTLLVIWEYAVKPLIAAVAEFLTAFLDIVFAIAKPVIRYLRFVWDILIKPLLVLAGVVLMGLFWVVKKVFQGLSWLFTMVILPAIEFVANIVESVFNAVEDALLTVLNYLVDWINKAAGWFGMGKIERFGGSTADKAKAKEKEAAEKLAIQEREKQELEEKNREDMQDAVKSGVVEGMEKAQNVVRDLYDMTKTEASGMLNLITDALSSNGAGMLDGSKIGNLVAAATKGLESGFAAAKGLDISSKLSGAKSIGNDFVSMLSSPKAETMQYANANNGSVEYFDKQMGFTPQAAGNTIVNNNNNVVNSSNSGGGSNLLPIISSGHTDPTKVSLQIGLRPPG